MEETWITTPLTFGSSAAETSTAAASWWQFTKQRSQSRTTRPSVRLGVHTMHGADASWLLRPLAERDSVVNS